MLCSLRLFEVPLWLSGLVHYYTHEVSSGSLWLMLKVFGRHRWIKPIPSYIISVHCRSFRVNGHNRSSSLCPYRRICRNPISSYKALSQLDSCHPIMWHPITVSWVSRMCVAARRLLCVRRGGVRGVVKLCYAVLVWKQNCSTPSLSSAAPPRRAAAAARRRWGRKQCVCHQHCCVVSDWLGVSNKLWCEVGKHLQV